MKKIIYALLVASLTIGCDSSNKDDGQEPEIKPKASKIVSKVEFHQNDVLANTLTFAYDGEDQIKTLTIKHEGKPTSGILTLSTYDEVLTFTKSGDKLTVIRNREEGTSVPFSFKLDKKGRVESGENESNTDMKATYTYSEDGFLTRFDQGVIGNGYGRVDGRSRTVTELLLGEEESSVEYRLSKNIIEPTQVNIDLNMLLVDMKSNAPLVGSIAFLDPAFLVMFDYAGERDKNLVASGARAFSADLKYDFDAAGAPTKITARRTVNGTETVTSCTISYK